MNTLHSRLSTIILFCLCIFLALPAQSQWKQDSTGHAKNMIQTFIPASALVVASISLMETNLDTRIQEALYTPNSALSQSRIDDVTQFVPWAMIGLYALGKPRTEWGNMALPTSLSLVSTLGITYALKYSIQRQRPNGGGQAWPSGHTSFAFAGAEAWYQLSKKEYPIAAYYGYIFASQVAVFRILKNKHWMTDVLAGAGIGILCSKLMFQLFPVRVSKSEKLHVFAHPAGISLSYSI